MYVHGEYNDPRRPSGSWRTVQPARPVRPKLTLLDGFQSKDGRDFDGVVAALRSDPNSQVPVTLHGGRQGVAIGIGTDGVVIVDLDPTRAVALVRKGSDNQLYGEFVR